MIWEIPERQDGEGDGVTEWVEAELRRRFNAVAREGRLLSKAEAGNVLREFVAEIEAESERYLETIKNPGPLSRE